MTTWAIEGPYIKTCNCDPGCPCDFNQAPTHGDCHGCSAMRIDRGHFGDVPLDGLSWIGLARWPGRLDEGDGRIQFVIDSAADDAQVEALTTILSGRAGGTLFEILNAVCPHKEGVVRAPIAFEWDLESRSAVVQAGDLFETRVETLRGIDPPTPYRVSVTIPGGFEYTSAEDTAEVALATLLRSTTSIDMDVRDGNANLAYVRHEGRVPSRSEEAAAAF